MSEFVRGSLAETVREAVTRQCPSSGAPTRSSGAVAMGADGTHTSTRGEREIEEKESSHENVPDWSHRCGGGGRGFRGGCRRGRVGQTDDHVHVAVACGGGDADDELGHVRV